MTLLERESFSITHCNGFCGFPFFSVQNADGCRRYAGMTDIADMPTYAYIAPFPHMQFAQVCIQRGKAARVPDFDVPAVTAAIPGFNDFPAS